MLATRTAMNSLPTPSSTLPGSSENGGPSNRKVGGGLDKASKIGIGLGVTLGFCVLLLVAGGIILRRQRVKRRLQAGQTAAGIPATTEYYTMKPELDGTRPVPYELPADKH